MSCNPWAVGRTAGRGHPCSSLRGYRGASFVHGAARGARHAAHTRVHQCNEPEVDIAVVSVPHIAHAWEFGYLDEEPHVQVRYVKAEDSLGAPDAIILPGTKSATGDLEYLRRTSLKSAIASHVGRTPIVGVCGGFEMLGRVLHDPERVESALGTMPGMGLLDIEVEFSPEKTTTERVYLPTEENPFREAGPVEGFEIHSGTIRRGACRPAYTYPGGIDGAVDPDRWIFGTFIHGLFRNPTLARVFIDTLRRRKGLPNLVTRGCHGPT
jgi:adenosylcobyric acid synthase